MTLHSLAEALRDTVALDDVAKQAGITLVQARAMLAALADLPVTQVVRMSEIAHRDRVRQINRETRTR